jgi:hypothetical protein
MSVVKMRHVLDTNQSIILLQIGKEAAEHFSILLRLLCCERLQYSQIFPRCDAGSLKLSQISLIAFLSTTLYTMNLSGYCIVN